MSVTLQIRPFNMADADTVIKFILDDLLYINQEKYSKAQIDGIVAYYTPKQLQALADDTNRIFLVAALQDKAIGTATLVKNEIRMVFVDRQFHKNGIGRSLVERIEKIARDQTFTKVKVDSSLNATGFYEKLGFTEICHKMSHNVEVVEMEKQL